MSKFGTTIRMSSTGMTINHAGETHRIENDRQRDRVSSILIADMQRRGVFNPRKRPSSDKMGA